VIADVFPKTYRKQFDINGYNNLLILISENSLKTSDLSRLINKSYQNTNYMIKRHRDVGLVKRVWTCGILYISLTEAGEEIIRELQGGLN
jgi:Mn-dependent DtxR family transcriptional regulator